MLISCLKDPKESFHRNSIKLKNELPLVNNYQQLTCERVDEEEDD
jgi:hypothetical protein